MSHPAAHTVEHIEKQHRSITPQPVSQHQSQTTPTAIMTATNAGSITATNRSKRRSKIIQPESIISTPASVTQEAPPSVNQSANDTNGTTGFFRIQSPTNTPSSNSTNNQATDIIGSNNTNPLVSLFGHASATTVSGRVGGFRFRCCRTLQIA